VPDPRCLASLVALLLVLHGMHVPAADFDAQFANPPARFRILKIVHNLPPAPEKQDAQIKTLQAQGFGGIVTNVPWANYLQGEPEWQVFLRAVREAQKAGMAMWLYDEHGYPSGVAFGQTLKDHPEWEARGLLIADAKSTGGPMSLDLPPGRLLRAAAFPVAEGKLVLDRAVELNDRVQERKLAWDAPAGSWHVMAITEDRLYEGTHAAVSLCDKLPYINLLQPEPTARFLQLTHDAYAARLDQGLGRWFLGTFTDEPSLMSLFLQAMPYKCLPWSPEMAAEFRARRGYALEPLLPALVADAGAQGARARYDFWQTVAELVSQNYFGQIRDWCRRHGLPSGGHLLLEEPLVMHVPLYGDLFRCERMLDAPSLDCLTSLPPQVHWYSARLVSSAAELEGRPDTMCETSDHAQRFRRPDDTRPPQVVTEDEIRGTCNRLILNGMTCITSYYSFKDLANEQLQRLNLWIGRCCMTLYGGHQVTDVAVVYPIESVWPRFIPSRDRVKEAPAAQVVANAYMGTAQQLFQHRRDFTFIDARTLAEARPERGVLRHRDLAWRAVVLPGVDTLPQAAWENLARFWREGGLVIAVDAWPTNNQREFPSRAVQELARELFGDKTTRCRVNPAGGAALYLAAGHEAKLPAALAAVLDPEVAVSDPAAPLRVTHRRIEGQETFFLINDSPQPWKGQVSFAAQGAGRQCDPATGAITPLAGPQAVPVELGPYGGMLYRFPQGQRPARRAVTAQVLSAL